METILELARAIGGILAVMVTWFCIQTFIRRRSTCGSNPDVLDFMKHGCAGCKGAGACHKGFDERRRPLL